MFTWLNLDMKRAYALRTHLFRRFAQVALLAIVLVSATAFVTGMS